MTAPEMAERLRAFLAERMDPTIRVEGLQRLPGGASREIWAFDAVTGAGERRELVLRRDPPGRSEEGDRELEYRVLAVAHRAGVPVPRPHVACSDPEVLGTPFYVMDRVAGEALPRRLLRDDRYAAAREALVPQLAAIAARIHAVDLDDPTLAGLPRPSPDASPAAEELERVTRGIRELAAEPHPVLELAARWLRERLPPRRRLALLHGDFRIGNVLFDERGVRAILDWELARAGDAVEDLGWLCTRAWRFGNDHLPAGGLATREALLDAYAKAGGEGVDPAHLRFWEAVGSYKVALVFIQQSWVYRTGRVDSLELAALGRRTAEAEEELVRIMEEDA